MLETLSNALQQHARVTPDLVLKLTDICRHSLNIGKVVVRRSIPAPKYHRYLKHSSVPTAEIQQLVTNELARSARTLKKQLLCHLPTDNNELYIEDLFTEYERFLTMNFFSKHTLIPSALVSYVWLLHCSFTCDYSGFCARVFSAHLPYVHTFSPHAAEIQDFRELYMNTLDFYRFLFQQQPDEGLWPDANARFKCQNTEYMWVSVFRVSQFLQRSSTPVASVEAFFLEYTKEVAECLFTQEEDAFSGPKGKKRAKYAQEFFLARGHSPDLVSFSEGEQV